MDKGRSFFNPGVSLENIRDNIVGYYQKVPLPDGSERQYINFDNAASTPALKPVLDKVNDFMNWYSSIHRGTGFKSQLCSEVYDYSREVVAQFVNIDLEGHTVIFGKNATEAINKLARRFPVAKDEVILVSKMEHHSNDLPWRANGRVIHIDVLPNGRLDEEHLVSLLKENYGKVALVAVTGASNVTGWVNDINHLAEICHEFGTKIFIDAAQLAPHRKIDMRRQSDPGHIDFLAFSAHKIYAPFGAGTLIGDAELFEQGEPDMVGGGTIKIVSLDHIVWADVPEKDEAGTPNTVGVVAMAKALQAVQEIGMDKIAAHEMALTRYMLSQMNEIPQVKILGGTDPEVVENRLGVIAFNVADLPHALTAAILNYEGAVGVRNGCFCAHPYLKILMGIDRDASRRLEEEIVNGDRSNLPGAVRASFGLYNTKTEIDLFITQLKKIAEHDYRSDYILDKRSGEYHLKDFKPDYRKYFQL